MPFRLERLTTCPKGILANQGRPFYTSSAVITINYMYVPNYGLRLSNLK